MIDLKASDRHKMYWLIQKPFPRDLTARVVFYDTADNIVKKDKKNRKKENN